MKRNTLFAIALTLLFAPVVIADLPEPKDPLVMPAIALRHTRDRGVHPAQERDERLGNEVRRGIGAVDHRAHSGSREGCGCLQEDDARLGDKHRELC